MGRASASVPPRVEEYVGDCVADFARRLEDAQVIALDEDRSRPAEGAIDGPSQTRPDRFHPPRQRFRPSGLHDEMRVVALQGVVHDSKIAAFPGLP